VCGLRILAAKNSEAHAGALAGGGDERRQAGSRKRDEIAHLSPPMVKHVTPQIASFTRTSHLPPGCAARFS
jgi:hypothetical protein